MNGIVPKHHTTALVLGVALTGCTGAVGELAADEVRPNRSVVTGAVVPVFADDFEQGSFVQSLFLIDGRSGAQVELEFEAGVEPPEPGAYVTVEGSRRGGKLRARDIRAADVQALVTPPRTGTLSTLVMVVDFADAVASCSPGSVDSLMFSDPNHRSVREFYLETSSNHLTFEGRVIGPLTVTARSTDACDFSSWADQADALAASSGVSVSSFAQRVYVMPSSSCRAAGLGGGGRSWVFGAACTAADVYAHELGHNLGLSHASTPSGEYGDNTDVMGLGQNRLRQLNAPHKEQLGWIAGGEATLAADAGTYPVAPLEFPMQTSGPQAIKVFNPTANDFYYVSYRRPIGFDSSLIGSSYADRLSIHTFSGAGKTYLLGFLADGESFLDPVSGISFTAVSHGLESATVQLQRQPPTCTLGTPRLTLTPAAQVAAPGAPLTYAVQLDNTDSAGCQATNFALGWSMYASGWRFSLSTYSAVVAPGQSTNYTITATSPTTAMTGSYTFTLRATDAVRASHAGSAVGTYSVGSAGFSMAGTVTASGVGLAGVLVSTGAHQATTDASGNFLITGLDNGSYTVTASRAGYTFSPSAYSVSISGANSTSINFVGTVQNGGPTVAAPPTATPSTVAGVSTTLSVLGADDGGEASLAYTWRATIGSAPVGFSPNGTNEAKRSVATFSASGTYQLEVTIRDASGYSTSAAVVVVVQPTLTSLVVSPSVARLRIGESITFGCSGIDQFGASVSVVPAWTASGGGTVSALGTYTGSTVGTFAVTAYADGLSAAATVTVAKTRRR